MIVIEHNGPGFLIIRISGKLSRNDYDAAIPELENALQLSGFRRAMITLEDFRGWEIDALWSELAVDIKHRKDFDRIAVLGDSKLEEWGTKLSNLFFSGKVRYFDLQERDAAHDWLTEDLPAERPETA